MRYLLEDLSELEYALELRLVCKEFNDIIIWELFNTKQYPITARRYQVHRGAHHVTPRKQLQLNLPFKGEEKTINVSWVARRWLLACIEKLAGSYTQRILLCRQLQSAAQALESLLTESASINGELRNALSSLAPFKFQDLEDKPGILMVCEAAVTFLGAEVILEQTRLLQLTDFESMDANFWLVNVACWSGSQLLLDHLEARASSTPISKLSVAALTLRCLPTAIRCGHKQMIRQILQSISIVALWQGKTLPCPIETAITVGDLEVLDTFLADVDPDIISEKLVPTLSFILPQQSPIQVSVAVLDRLLSIINLDIQKVFKTLKTQIGMMAGSAGLELFGKYHSLKALPLELPDDQTIYNPIGPLCWTGDVRTLKTLLAAEYYSAYSHEYVDKDLHRGSATALCHNHVEVFEELVSHIHEVNVAYLVPFLAAADGALPHIKRFCKATDLLNRPKSNYTTSWYSYQKTVGHAALEIAMLSLRPVNIEYFLDRGIRLPNDRNIVRISWSYRKRHAVNFFAAQQILLRYQQPIIVVSV